jgi:hypothetical protein
MTLENIREERNVARVKYQRNLVRVKHPRRDKRENRDRCSNIRRILRIVLYGGVRATMYGMSHRFRRRYADARCSKGCNHILRGRIEGGEA